MSKKREALESGQDWEPPESFTKDPKVFTISETCNLLSVSRATLHRWTKRYEATKGAKGLGPCVSLGKRRRGFPADVILTASSTGVED